MIKRMLDDFAFARRAVDDLLIDDSDRGCAVTEGTKWDPPNLYRDERPSRRSKRSGRGRGARCKA